MISDYLSLQVNTYTVNHQWPQRLQSLLAKEGHDVTLALCLGFGLALGHIDRRFLGRRLIFGERLPRRLFPSYYIKLVHIGKFQMF